MRISRLNRVKKFGISVSLTGIMVLSFGVVPVFAEETVGTVQNVAVQSDKWEGTGDEWSVKDGTGGYLKNAWFQDDVTGYWYMIGAGEDGILMYSGLVTDQSTGKTYLMNTDHDGTYGRLISVDGAYTINGQTVYLTFNQNHDGSYGAITGGLSEARETGVKETSFSAIPTGNNSSTSTQSQEGQNSGSNSGTGGSSGSQQNGSQMSAEEFDAWLSEISGGKASTVKGELTIDTDGGTLDDSNFHG